MPKGEGLSGGILVLGERAEAIATQLSLRGFSCRFSALAENTACETAPDAIVLAANSEKSIYAALQALRREPLFKRVPIVIDGDIGRRSRIRDVVDSIALSSDELAAKLDILVRDGHRSRADHAARERLDFVLDVARLITSGVSLGELAQFVAQGIERLFKCSATQVLEVRPNDVPPARLIDAEGMTTAVDVATSPGLRSAIETHRPFEVGDERVFALSQESAGLLAVKFKRTVPLSREERELLGAVGVQLASAAELARHREIVETERKRLESLYAERIEELRKANNRLTAIDRKTNEMVAVLSHDLRAPLNVLLGHTHLLTTGHLDAGAKKSAEVIERTSRKILGLIESILENNRGSEHTVLLTSRLDLAALAAEVARDLSILAREKGVQLRVEAESSVYIRGDAVKLRQVIQNLITNAKDHAVGATEIVVRVAQKPRPDGEVALLEVADNGQVADPSSLLIAFERAQGLGLAICREIIERHGGEIWAEQAPAGGALFACTLPLPTAPAEITSSGLWSRSKVPLVLVCKNDPVSLRATQATLIEHYRIATANDGLKALEKAKELAPAAIVMDVLLPKRDGIETLRLLKETPATSAIPVVMVATNGTPEEKAKAMGLGAVDVLMKPVAPATLLECLERSLATKQNGVHHLNGIDWSTGAHSPSGLMQRLQQELARSGRYRRSLAVMVLRAVPNGDESRAEAFASLVRQVLRVPDIVGDLGAGVVVAVLPETPAAKVGVLAARIAQRAQREGVDCTWEVLDASALGVETEAALDRALR